MGVQPQPKDSMDTTIKTFIRKINEAAEFLRSAMDAFQARVEAGDESSPEYLDAHRDLHAGRYLLAFLHDESQKFLDDSKKAGIVSMTEAASELSVTLALVNCWIDKEPPCARVDAVRFNCETAKSKAMKHLRQAIVTVEQEGGLPC